MCNATLGIRMLKQDVGLVKVTHSSIINQIP